MSESQCSLGNVPTKKPRITVYLNPQIKEWVEQQAQDSGRSESDIVASAMGDWLNPVNHCIQIPQVLMDALQDQAERNFRTVNQEILVALSKAMNVDIRDVINALNGEPQGSD